MSLLLDYSNITLELTASEALTLDQEYQMQKSWVEDEDKLTFIIHNVQIKANLPLDYLPSDSELSTSKFMVGDCNVFFHPDPDFDDKSNNLQYFPKKIAEIEIMLAEPSARGRGLARSSLLYLMRFCMERFSLLPSLQHQQHPSFLITKFQARIIDSNQKSQRLFESLGYKIVRRVEVFNQIDMESPSLMPADSEVANEKNDNFYEYYQWICQQCKKLDNDKLGYELMPFER